MNEMTERIKGRKEGKEMKSGRRTGNNISDHDDHPGSMITPFPPS